MGTRIGDVEVAVKLDTSGAQKQLDKLESNLKSQQRKIEDVNRGAQVTNQSATSVSGNQSAPAQGKALKAQGQAAQSSLAKLKAGLPARSVSGMLQPQSALENLVGPAGSAGLKLAGAAAAGYAVASATAKALPEITFILGKIANLESQLSGIQTGLEQFRRVFTTFESGLTTLPTAAARTKDAVTGALRLGADVPSISQISKEEFLEGVAQKELNKKLEQFKDREVMGGAIDASRRNMAQFLKSLERTTGLSLSR